MVLDATYCKARVNHRVVSQAVVIATGVRAVAEVAAGARAAHLVFASAFGTERPRQNLASLTAEHHIEDHIEALGILTPHLLYETSSTPSGACAAVSSSPRIVGPQLSDVVDLDRSHLRVGGGLRFPEDLLTDGEVAALLAGELLLDDAAPPAATGS